ncbi:MAG: membrane protein insertion efficiency factor YidD [Candidatus Latescibacteria bacterium]|nr:membrane protein insertion efficiency factor YidD [Candidatus Latescibacterota bacterium]
MKPQRRLERLPLAAFLCLLRLYRAFISPLLHVFFGPDWGCRFHPNCSEYARQCLERHSLGYGFYLATRRLLKCHPFHRGGYDPVPPAARRPGI